MAEISTHFHNCDSSVEIYLADLKWMGNPVKGFTSFGFLTDTRDLEGKARAQGRVNLITEVSSPERLIVPKRNKEEYVNQSHSPIYSLNKYILNIYYYKVFLEYLKE